MSTQTKRQGALTNADPVSQEAVVEYLYKQPDFFEQQPALLASLKLPHQTGGAAVSLVERQVSVLRQRNGKIERQLRELVSVARLNESLSGKIHKLCLQLLDAHSLSQVFERLESALREDFGADQVTLVMFGQPAKNADLFAANFVRQVSSEEPSLKAFQTFIAGGRPRCGQMRDVQRAFLFGKDNLHIGSAALVPLGEHCGLGMMAIGNKDSTHFHPAMSTDFLARLGEVVSAAITRYSLENAA